MSLPPIQQLSHSLSGVFLWAYTRPQVAVVAVFLHYLHHLPAPLGFQHIEGVLALIQLKLQKIKKSEKKYIHHFSSFQTKTLS